MSGTSLQENPHSPTVPQQHCGNCETPLAGPWCSQCGQHAHDSARTIGALLHDAWHSLTHLDGRFGQSLLLLFRRPGALTLEYFANRRARQVPPFRLYLVCSVVFFALASLTAAHGHRAGPALTPDTAKESATDCRQLKWGNDTAPPWLQEACLRVTHDNGQSLGRAFLANAPKMMFVLLPLVAALMVLFWWRPRRLYVEHLVFSLHTHAFMFSMFSLLMLLSAVGNRWPLLDTLAGVLSFALWLWVLAYPWLAMRRYYGQSRLRTTLKFVVLFTAYSMLLSAVLLGTVVLSALAL